LTKYSTNSLHFKSSPNYLSKQEILAKAFEFPQKITLSQNIPSSKHTLGNQKLKIKKKNVWFPEI
jgi:hypothetical protein